MGTELTDASRVAGDSLTRQEELFFAVLQTGSFDLIQLVSEEFHFPGGALVVLQERGLLVQQAQERAARAGELCDQAAGAGKSVDESGLLVARKEALMIMRAMKIDQEVSEGAKNRKSAGRTVRELFARSLRGQRALKKQAPVLARFSAMTGEQGRYSFIVDVLENSLDRASVRIRANEVLVRPLSEDEGQRAEDDGLARSGLSRNGYESVWRLPSELFDEREIANAQRGERCGHERTMP